MQSGSSERVKERKKEGEGERGDRETEKQRDTERQADRETQRHRE